MSTNLIVTIATCFAMTLEVGLASAQSPAGVAPSDYRILKANCSSVASAGRTQCVKDAKDKGNAAVGPKTKETLWRCEDLRSREERACIIRELEEQHPDPARPGQGGNGTAEALPSPR